MNPLLIGIGVVGAIVTLVSRRPVDRGNCGY